MTIEFDGRNVPWRALLGLACVALATFGFQQCAVSSSPTPPDVRYHSSGESKTQLAMYEMQLEDYRTHAYTVFPNCVNYPLAVTCLLAGILCLIWSFVAWSAGDTSCPLKTCR